MIIAGLLTVTPIVYVQLKNDKNSIQKQTQIFSLYMLTMLLISPLGETSHLIYLYPAMLITTVAVFQDLQRYLKYGVIILTLILMSFIIGRFYISVNLIAIIILYGSLLWLILNSSRWMKPGSLKISSSF